MSTITVDQCTAPLLAADSPVAIEGEYIVVFRDEVTIDQGNYWYTGVISLND